MARDGTANPVAYHIAYHIAYSPCTDAPKAQRYSKHLCHAEQMLLAVVLHLLARALDAQPAIV